MLEFISNPYMIKMLGMYAHEKIVNDTFENPADDGVDGGLGEDAV